MHIFITGISGLIGRELARFWVAQGHQVSGLSRQLERARQALPEGVRLVSSLAQAHDLLPDAVVNLAGEPIADQRWSAARRQVLAQSRVALTAELVTWMAGLARPPACLISGSAVGYYGRQGAQHIDESALPHDEYAHQLCRDWEREAEKAKAFTRVCVVRTGLVVSPQGGFLGKMRLPFSLGLGGRLGVGTQGMSWIHLRDQVGAIDHLLRHTELSGAFNLTAPTPVSNAVFTQVFAAELHRPAFFHVPAWVLRLALGEMSDLLLTGQYVLPKRLLDSGYVFQFSTLKDALADIRKTA